MATHWSILAWRTPWTEEPDGYCPWGCKELDMTEWLTHITRSYFFGQRQFIPFLLKDSREWALGGLWLSVLSRVLLFETPTDCSLPISSVPGILQARIQEQVAISFSRIFQTQGSNPHPLHGQADSLTLRHRGSPKSLKESTLLCGWGLGWTIISSGFLLADNL